MREAINIWRQSDMNDFLEGLETDPVLSLMLTALAYQMNEAVGDMEMLKTEVLEEYAHLLTPYEVGHAVPATVVLETALQDSIQEIELTPQSEFTLAGTSHVFIPVLRSRVMNAKVRSIVRMDGRRWKVTLQFKSPVNEISGLSFAVRNMNFQDVKVTIKGQPVPLVKPWDYAAGSLIVQEAGGLVQMPLAGEEMDYNLSTAVLSANPQCMPMALEVFRKTVSPDLGQE